jgi:periplasmic protein TonB
MGSADLKAVTIMRPAKKITVDLEAMSPPLYFDEDFLVQSHWRRFSITIILAALASALMLAGFAAILSAGRPLPPPRTSAVEATLIEPPRPKPAKPKPIAPILRPTPRRSLARIRPRKQAAPPPPEAHSNQPPSALPASSAGGIATGRATVPSESEESGEGGGSGGASENIGARALYDPVPQIPDDLRENVFSAVAIAHFVVDQQGHVQVTLVKPTTNPRLNQIILDSLRTWKFFPAISNGVPVASEFDVRIPIAVQ